MMNFKSSGFILCCLVSFSLGLTQPQSYPQKYFRNPLDVLMDLSANFGELRSNHWHMGLDIRTKQKSNLPVYAAADGYISKVRIEPFGFGRVIYISHPNGLTTLYAHLNNFYPELEQYITEKQYEMESWRVELQIPRNLLQVKKGQFIAYSGNNGASQGPHLHFEIRDSRNDKCLDPLKFGFPVKDDVPPTLVRLAMYERSISIYEQSPTLFRLKKSGNGYIIPNTTGKKKKNYGEKVIVTGSNKISFAIQAHDLVSRSSNGNGIYSAVLFFDDTAVIGFSIDSIDYVETKYMNAHIDFRYKKNGGPYLQHLSKLPGDMGPVYKLMNGDGVIRLNDANLHKVRVEVKDAYSNTSILNFQIRHSDSLMTFGGITSSHTVFYPGVKNEFKREDFEIITSGYAMYDSVHIFYNRNDQFTGNAISALHQIGNVSIPVHDDIEIRIKPVVSVPQELNDKIVIRRNDGGGENVQKAVCKDGWFIAKFDEFGSFQAFIDQSPPYIKDPGTADTLDFSAKKRIVFQPDDNFGIKRFNAELDDKWIRFTNDKGRSYIYIFDERCPFGVHKLKVTVDDIVGNTVTKTWWFKRYKYTPPKKKAVKKKGSSKKKGSKKKKNKK
jgi:murein DD-endopeptidase MepM/ murein hydrolase activator NlpD